MDKGGRGVPDPTRLRILTEMSACTLVRTQPHSNILSYKYVSKCYNSVYTAKQNVHCSVHRPTMLYTKVQTSEQ